jgi:uncharacterized protein YdbL (DUF1318 family)
MTTLTLPRFLLCLVAFCAAVLPGRAEDLAAVRARMSERLPALVALRQQGAIGENNRGYTEVRRDAQGASAVSAAENRDREIVYAAIAKQQGGGVSAEQVGRARARQIAAQSPGGTWLQSESGQWYQKE